MAVTAEELILCNNKLSTVYLVGEEVPVIGTVVYTPENGELSVVIYNPDCCDMIILSPDDIDILDCSETVPE